MGIVSIVIGVVVSTGSTLATFFHGNSGRTSVIYLGRVHDDCRAAYSNAYGLGRYPAGAFRLQIDISRNLFRHRIAYTVVNRLCIII